MVAADVFRYLKTSAEKALGVEVKEAVICHPAAFATNQIEMLVNAARSSGLEVLTFLTFLHILPGNITENF